MLSEFKQGSKEDCRRMLILGTSCGRRLEMRIAAGLLFACGTGSDRLREACLSTLPEGAVTQDRPPEPVLPGPHRHPQPSHPVGGVSDKGSLVP